MFYDPGLSSGGFKKRTFAEKKHISGRWFQPTPLKIVVIIPTIVVIYGYMMGLQHIIYIYICLAGGIPTPLKNMKVSWDYDIPNTWKNKIPVPNH